MTGSLSGKEARADGPDLTAVSVSGGPFAIRGFPYLVEVVMKNDGNAPAADFFFGIYASDNVLITSTDTLLGAFGPLTLMPGDVVSLREVVTLSATIAEGHTYLGLIADTFGTVDQQNEADKVAHSVATITIRDAAPDFTASNILVPESAAAGEMLSVSRTVSNLGPVPGVVEYGMYLTRTSSIDPMHDVLLKMGTLTLDAMQDQDGADFVRIPGDVAPGEYRVGYLFDPNDRVDELRKDNNAIVSAMFAVLMDPIHIVTSTIASGTPSVPYVFALGATGGTGAYTWSIGAGSLPPGLLLDSSRGWISGTPTSEGSFPFTVECTDGHFVADRRFRLRIADATLPLEVATRALIPASIGRQYEYPLAAFGGVPPYLWKTKSPLPSGFELFVTGDLTGTATAASARSIDFEVTDSLQSTATRTLVLQVFDATGGIHLSTDALPDGRVGHMYDETLGAVPHTGAPPFTFEVTDGTFPPGLMLAADATQPGQARIFGVPAQVGSFTFTFLVRDARNDFAANLYVVVIEADHGVGFTTTSLPQGTAGKRYRDARGAAVVVKASAPVSSGTVAIALSSGDLPPGIRLLPNGTLTGTPTAGGIYSFILSATDAANERDLGAFGIEVTTSTPTRSKGGCGCSASAERSSPAGAIAGALLLVLLGLEGRRRIWCLLGIALVVVGVERAEAQPAGLAYGIRSFGQTYAPRTGPRLDLRTAGAVDLDNGTATVTIPFAFRYYGANYTTLLVSANGIASFDPSAFIDGNNTALPVLGSLTDLVIAPFWDDLTVTGVITTVEGAAPNRVFIVEWDGVHPSAGPPAGTTSFQLWLYEGPGSRFEAHYGPLSGTVLASRWSGTSGFQNKDGSDGRYFLPCESACDGDALTAANGIAYHAEQDAGVELFATGLTSPPALYPPAPFSFSATMTSLHQEAMGPFIFQVHLMAPFASQPNDPIYTSQPITLAPYEERVVTDRIALPASTPIGHYHLALVLDPNRQVPQMNRNDSVLISDIDVRVEAPKPDFAIPLVTVPRASVLAPGASLDITFELANLGSLDGTARWTAYLSPNAVITTDDTSAATGTLAISFGTTATVSAHLVLPADIPSGTYFVGVYADPMNQVDEIDESNNTGVAAQTITVAQQTLNVRTNVLPRGYTGTEYSALLAAAGGDGTYAWSLAKGTLPAGLDLIDQTGEIHGVPTQSGTFPITVQAASANLVATQDLSLEIAPLTPRLTIVTRVLLPGILSDVYPPSDPGVPPAMQQHIVAVNGTGPVTFTLTSSAPPGLILDPDGYLHGVPRALGVVELAVAAKDATSTAARNIALTIGQPGRLEIVADNLPDARIGEDYEYLIQVIGDAANGMMPLVFTTNDTLPPGLALSSIGLLSGVPEEVGTTVFSVRVHSGQNPPQSDIATFQLRVQSNAAFEIAPLTLPVALLGTSYDETLDVILQGGEAAQPITWRVQGGPLPPGLSTMVRVVESRALLAFTGTATAAGFATVLVSADDALGRHAEAPISIEVTKVVTGASSKRRCGCREAAGTGGAPTAALLALLWLVRIRLARKAKVVVRRFEPRDG